MHRPDREWSVRLHFGNDRAAAVEATVYIADTAQMLDDIDGKRRRPRRGARRAKAARSDADLNRTADDSDRLPQLQRK